MNSTRSKSQTIEVDTTQINQTIIELRTIVYEQSQLILALSNRIDILERQSKSNAFELESTPVSSKSKSKSSPKKSKSVEVADKIVNKTAFYKELANSQFSHYLFENEKLEYNWTSLAEHLELTITEKMTVVHYKAIIDKLIDDHIEDGAISIAITKKNIQYILIINSSEDNVIENTEKPTKSKQTVDPVYTKSVNGEIVDIHDKEIFSKRVYFSVVEEFIIDGSVNVLEDLEEKEKTINYIYKSCVDKGIKGRHKVGDLFIMLSDYFETEQKSFTITVLNKKTSERYRYTYKQLDN